MDFINLWEKLFLKLSANSQFLANDNILVLGLEAALGEEEERKMMKEGKKEITSFRDGNPNKRIACVV